MTDQFITFGPHKIRRDLIVAVSIGCTQVLAKKARWFSLDPFYDFKPRNTIVARHLLSLPWHLPATQLPPWPHSGVDIRSAADVSLDAD